MKSETKKAITETYPPALWIAAREKQRKERESLRQSVLADIYMSLEKLSRRFSWETAYVFGSVTKPNAFGKGSDVDVAVRGLPKTDYYAFVGAISSLMGRPVDVLNLEECPFSQQIETRGIRWNPKEASKSS